MSFIHQVNASKKEGKFWQMLGLSLLIIFKTMNYAIGESLINPADQDAIFQQQKAFLDEAKQQRESLQRAVSLDVTEEKAPESESDNCFPVHEILFNDAYLISNKNYKKLIKPFVNQCLTVAKINELVRNVSNFYIRQGFITSQAFLEPQDISGGLLTISVQEGKIERITLDDKTPLVLSVAFPGLTGNALNLRDIEQGLEQLNRLTSQRVSIDIVPGAAPGYSVIALTYGPRRFPADVSLSVDNSGQKSTGVGQMSASLTVDNPFNFADQWTFSVGRNTNFRSIHRSRHASANVMVPYGYWTLGYSYAWNDYFYDIPLRFSTWRYDGKSESHRFTISRVLFRNGNSKLTFNGGVVRRKTTIKLADEKLDISSPTLSSFTLGLNFSSSWKGGYFTFNPALYQGFSLFGATKDLPYAPDAPKSRFRKVSLNASYYTPLDDKTYYFSSLYAQWAYQNLYSAERISIGGDYSVRGFKEQSLAGNRGFYIRNEINRYLKTFPALGELSLTAALDSGWLQSQPNRVDGGNVIGAALSFSLSGKWLSQSLTFGMPLRYPHDFNPDKWVSYYQLSMQF